MLSAWHWINSQMNINSRLFIIMVSLNPNYIFKPFLLIDGICSLFIDDGYIDIRCWKINNCNWFGKCWCVYCVQLHISHIHTENHMNFAYALKAVSFASIDNQFVISFTVQSRCMANRIHSVNCWHPVHRTFIFCNIKAFNSLNSLKCD